MSIPVTTSGKLTMATLFGIVIITLLIAFVLGGDLRVFAIVFPFALLGLVALITSCRWWDFALRAPEAVHLLLSKLTGSIGGMADSSDPIYITVVSVLGLLLISLVA